MRFPNSRMFACLTYLIVTMIAAICIDFSRYHECQNGDSLIPVMVSLYKWELFYWGQSRLGMLLPSLVAWCDSPYWNLMLQNFLGIWGVMLFYGVFSWYLVRNSCWLGIASIASITFLLTFPLIEQFHVMNGSQPYPIALFLSLSSILLSSQPGSRIRWCLRFFVSVVMMCIAFWYNSGLLILIPPLITFRFFSDMVGFRWRATTGFWNRLKIIWSQYGGREYILGSLLAAIGLGVGLYLSSLSEYEPIATRFTNYKEWPGVWAKMVERVDDRFPMVRLLSIMGFLFGLFWLVAPTTRRLTSRYIFSALILILWVVTELLLLGTLEWLKTNSHDIRYLFPVIMGMALMMACLVAGPFLEHYSSIRIPVSLVITLLIPLACIQQYGIPSYAASRTALDKSCGFWTQEILENNCTHIIGDYWSAWNATFHVNMIRYEQGHRDVIWAATGRAMTTRWLWTEMPWEEIRLAKVIPTNSMPDYEEWDWAFPKIQLIDKRRRIHIYAAIDPDADPSGDKR